jgi:tetratricopeptide (TPR) repeat protein
LLPVSEKHLAKGNCKAAYTTASSAASMGERFGDTDLIACARHLQGRALIQQGKVQAGLALLDEAMVAVTAGELSPIVTGLIYCSVIETCQQVYAWSRAREWTSALAQWCERQPEMIAFTETCLVHRAEIMQLHGAWPEAIEEARRAWKRSSQAPDPTPSTAAFYQLAELHRLRGDFAAAEEAYRNASRGGREPQPGLALLRMAQGRASVAAASIRGVVSATTGGPRRATLLPAYVEIMLAVGDTREARSACLELEEIAQTFDTDVLGAMAAQARGAVELAEGNAQVALGSLRARGGVAGGQSAIMPHACGVGFLPSIGDDDGGLELEGPGRI